MICQCTVSDSRVQLPRSQLLSAEDASTSGGDTSFVPNKGQSTHFVWKEGNVLFNDALNTFYLRLYGVIHMVKDHSESERGNLLPPHGLLFLISSKGSFICIIPAETWVAGPTNRIAHITAFLTPVVEHWLEREIAQWTLRSCLSLSVCYTSDVSSPLITCLLY